MAHNNKQEQPENAACFDRPANLLGALALTVTDRISGRLQDESVQSETAAVTLSALYHFLDGTPIDLIRRVLGLTSSGTVRLVDRLENARYVRRESGEDGRVSLIFLTDDGRKAAQSVARTRANVLEEALTVLSPKERTAFDLLIGKVLVGLIREPGATKWTCRFCDTKTCGFDTAECPVTAEVQKKYGDSSAQLYASQK